MLRTAAITAMLALAATAPAEAAPKAKASTPSGPVAWCGEGTDTLPNGLCHIDGGQPENGRRTLVIFLHGMIAKDVDWQWLQERALTRQAKASHFEAVFARAPLGPSGYVWPGTREDQEAHEQALIDGWNAARAYLEKKSGKYDEVFLMGFSSGAYFTSSLVLRGRTSFDGYAVFAGGAAGINSPDANNKVPVYVGVCADDRQTADHSRAFGNALAARGFPSRVDEQHVGHMFSDIHMLHALTWLRGQTAKKSKTD